MPSIELLLVVASCGLAVSSYASAPGLGKAGGEERGSLAGSSPEGLDEADWSSLRAAYEAGRRKVSEGEGGHRAENPGQQWVTRFDGRGFTTTPHAGAWTWGLELESCGFPGSEERIEERAPVSVEGTRVAYAWSDALEEWFENEGRGLEHGFTLHRRPVGEVDATGPLTFTFAVRGGLRAEVQANGRDVWFRGEHGAAVVHYTCLLAFDADGRELPARFEQVPDGLRLTVQEDGARYPLTIDPIAQQAYLKASNTGALDRFGSSVSISGDTLVVGAMEEDSSATGVDGDQIDDDADNSGAAYVFLRTGTSWSQQAYLKASNTEEFDGFGGSVSVSGDTLIVGAPYEDSAATGVNGDQDDDSANRGGAAYVFVRNGTTWSQQAYLKASNTQGNDLFGMAVSVSGDTVVVGAWNEDSSATGMDGDQGDNGATGSGAAYVFVRSGTSWSQQAYIKASNTGAFDRFGESVAASGDTVVIGAEREASASSGVDGDQSDDSASGAGAAYVFVRNGTTWSQQAYLKASNAEGLDYFGSSVSVSGDTIVVGASGEASGATGVDGDQDDDSADTSGAAYVFTRNAGSWGQQAYLKASNTDPADMFGKSVSVSDDTIVVGARGEDSASTEVNGDPSNHDLFDAGAAYVFVRHGPSWHQHAYLKASNSHDSARFGGAVAVSGNTVVVGAEQESSSSTGVNGDQDNEDAPLSGAAYVFVIDPTAGPGAPLCFGDGSVAPCACGNEGLPDGGCANSAGAGASVYAIGDASLSSDSLELIALHLPNTPGLTFQGNTALPSPDVFGDGLRCCGDSSVRLITMLAQGHCASTNQPSGCGTQIGGIGGAISQHPGNAGLQAGDTRCYQHWYRDPIAGPCGTGFNLSNGYEVTWGI